METAKKILIFSQKKAVLLFWETETSKKFLIYQETETLKNFRSWKNKKCLVPSFKTLIFP